VTSTRAGREPKRGSAGRWVVPLVLVGCALIGYFVLPLLGVGKHPLVGNPAPAFDLEVISGGHPGNRIRLDDYRGRTVVLDFWATWCRPCRAQMPIIDELAREHSRDVAVIGVNTDDALANAVAFARQSQLAYPNVYDSGEVFASYGGMGLPTLVVISPTGRVFAVRQGVTRKGALEELVRQASR